MSVIKISCIDQAMTFTNTPIIASGGLNEDQVEFTFCSLWDGYVKMAVFTKEDNIYYVSIDETTNQAIVPNGILSSNGRFYIGVVGYKDNVRRTSEMLPYTVVDGAVSPSPEPDTDNDVFADMLSLVTEARDIATQTQERQAEFEKEIAKQVGDASIPDGAVTTAKLADGAVTAAKLAAGSITAATVGAIPTSAKGAASGVATLDASSKVVATQASAAIKTYTGSVTLPLADAGCLVRINSAAAATVTVPALSFPEGTEIEVLQLGVGAVTFAAASGVTLLSVGGALGISDQYGVACLKNMGGTTWLLGGALK